MSDTMSESTTVTTDEGDVSYVEEGDVWVQVDTRGGRERRKVLGPNLAPEDHPNKPEGWEPSEEDKVPLAPGDAAAAAASGGTSDTSSASTEETTTPDGRPAGNASREDWLAYAQANGVDVGDAATATRSDIIAACEAAGK